MLASFDNSSGHVCCSKTTAIFRIAIQQRHVMPFTCARSMNANLTAKVVRIRYNERAVAAVHLNTRQCGMSWRIERSYDRSKRTARKVNNSSDMRWHLNFNFLPKLRLTCNGALWVRDVSCTCDATNRS